jgi:hypothetical protein
MDVDSIANTSRGLGIAAGSVHLTVCCGTISAKDLEFGDAVWVRQADGTEGLARFLAGPRAHKGHQVTWSATTTSGPTPQCISAATRRASRMRRSASDHMLHRRRLSLTGQPTRLAGAAEFPLLPRRKELTVVRSGGRQD